MGEHETIQSELKLGSNLGSCLIVLDHIIAGENYRLVECGSGDQFLFGLSLGEHETIRCELELGADLWVRP